jgi:glycosyltransferase involved in cell wall biosynthesis
VRTVHVVVPDGIDDPRRPSGGNVYDRKVCASLPGAGWRVHEHPVPGPWPEPDARAAEALAQSLRRVPDDAVVVVDGLIASTTPSVLVPAAVRLRLVVLLHLPLGAEPPGHVVPGARDRERAVLAAAQATVTTSEWARGLVLRTHPVLADRVHVAAPGTDPAPLAPGSLDGGRLLCVATVAWHKGHDVLLTALAGLRDLQWQCVCVGPPGRDTAFVEELRRRVGAAGLSDRVCLSGALAGSALESAYACADVVVLPSRGETHGMVVSEALAHGLPVIATAVGGVPDAVGRTADGRRPALLVPPDDPASLAAALRRWIVDAPLRDRLRQSAAVRRVELPGWSTTARAMAYALSRAAA